MTPAPQALPDQRRRYRVYIDDHLLQPTNFLAALTAAETGGSVNSYIIGLRKSQNRDLVLAFAENTQAIVITNLTVAADDHPTVVAFHPSEPERQLEIYGLAMSDALVVNDQSETYELVAEGKRLGKQLLLPGGAGSEIRDLVKGGSKPARDAISELRRLEPRPRANAFSTWIARRFGQTDGVITELLAALAELVRFFDALLSPWLWPSAKKAAAGPHFSGFFQRMRKAIVLAFGPVDLAPYFAPQHWEKQCPSAVLDASPLLKQFNWLDVSALAGARTYRAIVWWLYTFAWAAVAAAVLGYMLGNPDLPFVGIHLSGFAVLEVVLVGTILLVVRRLHKSGFQHRWTAARIGAEQLRIAAMALPVHVVPPMLATPDQIEGTDGPNPRDHNGKDLKAAAVLAFIKRTIREHDPVRMSPVATVATGACWVKYIVDDQHGYHARNHRNLETVEFGVQAFNAFVFGAVIIIVLMHLFHPFWHAIPDLSWGLFVTACGPAVAATLHGAAGRLEISHRSELSRAYGEELARVSEELQKLIDQPASTDWNALRELTRRAIGAMGSEADAWHSTMLLEPVSLP